MDRQTRSAKIYQHMLFGMFFIFFFNRFLRGEHDWYKTNALKKRHGELFPSRSISVLFTKIRQKLVIATPKKWPPVELKTGARTDFQSEPVRAHRHLFDSRDIFVVEVRASYLPVYLAKETFYWKSVWSVSDKIATPKSIV